MPADPRTRTDMIGRLKTLEALVEKLGKALVTSVGLQRDLIVVVSGMVEDDKEGGG